MSRHKQLGVAALVLVVSAGISCTRSEDVNAAAPPTTTSNAAPAAATSQGQPGDYVTSGPIVVENQLDVLAQRDGVVAQIAADIGHPVRKGDLLAQLDDRQLQAQLSAEQDDLQASESNHKRWIAQAGVAKADLDRDQALFDLNVVSKSQLEHASYALQAAQFEADREAHNVDFFKSNMRSTQLEIDKMRILAPFDGVVARRYIRQGQKVAPNERLFWVTAVAPLQVRFTLPQQFVGKIGKGSDVAVADDATHNYTAKVVSVSPVVDPASGTIEVIAQLAGGTSGLFPGMTVNIRVQKHP